MSDVPFARELIRSVLDHAKIDAPAKTILQQALSMLTREAPCRRARPKRIKLTSAIKAQIRELAAANPNKSMHEISEETGVHNIGRVSEVLNGKR